MEPSWIFGTVPEWIEKPGLPSLMNRLDFQFVYFPGDFEDRRMHVIDYVFRRAGSRCDSDMFFVVEPLLVQLR